MQLPNLKVVEYITHFSWLFSDIRHSFPLITCEMKLGFLETSTCRKQRYVVKLSDGIDFPSKIMAYGKN